MEKELKAKLDEAIELAMTQWLKERDAGKFDPPEGNALKPVLPSTVSVLPGAGSVLASTGTRAVHRFVTLVRNRLRRGPHWKDVQKALVAEIIMQVLWKELSIRNKVSIDPLQMTLPGFENLPKRIGSKGLTEVTLSAFFAYRDKYSRRADREKARVEELEKIATKVIDIYTTEPEAKLGDAIRRAEAPREPETKPFLVKAAAK